MFNLLNWLWSIRHRRLIQETKEIINLKLLLRALEVKQAFSAKELKELLRIIKGQPRKGAVSLQSVQVLKEGCCLGRSLAV